MEPPAVNPDHHVRAARQNQTQARLRNPASSAVPDRLSHGIVHPDVASGCVTIRSVRVVLDTNILVSACWKPGWPRSSGGRSGSHAARITACVSAEILAEYRDVLSRPKLAGISGRALELLAALERAAFSWKPRHTSRHPSMTTTIASSNARTAAGAPEFLITGNLRHYPENWAREPHIRIVNARTFLSNPLCARRPSR